MAVLQNTTITGGLTMNGMSAGFMKISPTGIVTVDGNAYLTAITSGQITGALGYTPYNSSNPNGYITSSSLSSYLPLSGGTMTGTLAMHQGAYYGTITFGSSSYWRAGISQRDAGNAELRIWAKGGGAGSIYFATNFDGESGSTALPSDGMALKNNNLGLGSWGVSEFPSYKLHVKGTGYATSDFRAPIFYDSDDTGYYADFNTTGTSIRTRGEIFIGANSSGRYLRIGGNGGATDEATVSASNGNLHIDCKAGNGLYLNYYSNNTIYLGSGYTITGNGAYYNGRSATSDALNGWGYTSYVYRSSGSGYYQVADWMQFNTSAGLYWPSYNGAHIYPNGTSYGSIRIDGSRNGWSGIYFDSGVTLMMNSNESGHHREGYGWQYRWDNGTLYCHKNSYGGGTSATVWDSVNAPRASNSNLVYYAGFTLDANSMPTNSTGFTYSNGAPTTGPIVRFGDGNYDLQFNAYYYWGDQLYYRTRNGDTGNWNNWQTIVTSSNIGNYSVGYANNASYANEVQVNYDNDNNSQYQMLWGSGNSVYGTGDIYCNPGTDTIYSNAYSTVNIYDYYTPQNFATVTQNPYNSYNAPGFMAANFYDQHDGFYTQNNYSHFNYNGYNSRQENPWGTGSMGLGTNSLYFSSNSGQGGSYTTYSSWGLYFSGSDYNGQFNPNYIQCNNSTGYNFTWNAYDSGNMYIGGTLFQNQGSDAKLKDNVVPISNALDKLKQIRGVEFDWNELGKEYMGKEGRDIGVIAQEVQSVLPLAVREHYRETEDKVLSHLVVDYDKLNPLSIQAINELAFIVEELKLEIQTLKSQINGSSI